MENKKFLPYGRHAISAEDIQEVSKVLESDTLTRGSKVSAFEQAVATYCGANYAVAFSSGTSALMGACFAAGLGPHDRIITTPNTFVATVGAGMLRRSVPVFVDIDLETGNFNLDQVGYALETRSTRGKNVVIPVHFSGISVDMRVLEEKVRDPDTVIIEDAAHALGSLHPDGSKVGSCKYSDMAIFSFHPVKNITTGEGGMVTTNNDALVHRLKQFRNNGIEREPPRLHAPSQPWYYEVQEITGNFNLTDFQAALGISQLRRLDQIVLKRRQLVAAYRKHLEYDEGIAMFSKTVDAITAFHLFVVQIDFESFSTSRTEVMTQLMDEGVGTQLHYIPVYHHPFFKRERGDISGYFPKMERYYATALSLPLFPEMELIDVEKVVRSLRGCLESPIIVPRK